MTLYVRTFTGTGCGTGSDARRNLLNILEASIDSPVDLHDSIQRHQNYLQYARSQLNFVVGEGLYLLPSEMNLRIGRTRDIIIIF